MNIVLFTHPAFLGSQSQPRFARMLLDACLERGHGAELMQPGSVLQRRLPKGLWSKWGGYVDQYLIFPRELRRRLSSDPADTLYVFCDQALGPWVPIVAHRPHVVHCHDLLALRSALGLVPQNPTSLTGRIYQRYIRRGFRRARHFISISEKTRTDLHTFGGISPTTSAVVYNGLNFAYQKQPREAAGRRLERDGLLVPDTGILLHVGGGQWYKNTEGVIALYGAYVEQMALGGRDALPLWLVSPPPGARLQARIDAIPYAGQIRFIQQVDNETLEALYSVARALLFPSLAEGFGWPIAEALACGCPVLTTGDAPMNEVGGPCAHYLPRLNSPNELPTWSRAGAELLCQVLDRPAPQRAAAAQAATAWTRRFDPDRAIDSYLSLYEAVLAAECGSVRLRPEVA